MDVAPRMFRAPCTATAAAVALDRLSAVTSDWVFFDLVLCAVWRGVRKSYQNAHDKGPHTVHTELLAVAEGGDHKELSGK